MRTERIISSIPKDIEDGECLKGINAGCPRDNNAESSMDKVNECPQSRYTTSCPQSEPANSSISTNWVYPSPKMFWDAMNRKGTLPSHLANPDAPKTQEELEWIVTIHNVVNEQCWQEICKWERFRIEGCRNAKSEDSKLALFNTPVLQRFLGRPDDLSPRAWFKSTILGYRRPFDRHDWYIRTAHNADSTSADPPRRYIIDFYAGNQPGNKETVSSFYLDVRPAVDSFDSIKLRMRKYICEKMNEIKNVFNK